MPVRINGYLVDVTTNESHIYDSTVTMDPVEDGSPISDHQTMTPIVVTLTGVISNTPFGTVAEARNEGEKHSQAAYDDFRDTQTQRKPVLIETDLWIYKNMILKKLSIPKTATTGDALIFTAEFVQINIVTSERRTILTKNPRGKKKNKRGLKLVIIEPTEEESKALTSKAAALAAKGRLIDTLNEPGAVRSRNALNDIPKDGTAARKRLLESMGWIAP